MSSSSSSSLLYINVLLLVLIHSSLQTRILSDEITNATRELTQVQGLKSEYQQNLTTSENNYYDLFYNLIDKQSSVEEELEEFEDCQTEVNLKKFGNRFLTNLNKFQEELRINHPEHSEKIIKELNKDIVNMEKHLEKLENEKVIGLCDEPENIDSNDLAKLSELLLKYIEDDYHIALYTLKEEHLSELIKILKNSAEKNSVK
uniref:Uncharacterized protein n=1 Tax=Schistosoma japonicum TaxID=6182 RepID=C1LGZ9_SCHJA|nr:hypothetical protein [Schistosoma japonicum]